MKRFIINATLIVAINVAIALTFLAVMDSRRSFGQWETDSILYVIPKHEQFDFVSLGTSRARVFSEFKGNHDYVEHELKLKFLNLAIPFGGGIRPEKMFLEYFFDRGNETKVVLFLLDPFMMFSDGSNKYHRFVFYEPFRFRFLFKLFQNRIPIQQIITYVRSKFGYYWFTRETVVKQTDPRVVDPKDSDADMARKRMESLYPEGMNEQTFSRYAADLTQIMNMAARHQARLVIVFPPTLLGPEPGAPRVKQFLESCRPRYAFEFHDYTGAMLDNDGFADHDHLNSRGFERFVAQYLAPILKTGRGFPPWRE